MLSRLIKAGLAVLCILAAMPGGAATAETKLATRQIALTDKIGIGDRVNHIRFLGMLELPDMTAEGLRFSQLSGLAWDDDDGILYAISDKGFLFHLQPEFRHNALTGLKLLRAVPLREPGSGKSVRWSRADAEGLDILNGRNGRPGDAELIVSFERIPRLMRYHPDGRAIGEYPVPAPLNDTKAYRNANKMLESVCVDAALGVIAAPETPLKDEREGYTRLFGLSGPSWLYPFAPGNRITDIACLGKAEVLVLEQNYRHVLGQITMMLKRVRLPAAPSTTLALAPETLLTLDSNNGFQIDNFEGLAHHRGRRFFMVSDNNDLFVQRTLLMYFELLD